ncbi:hypothetical protein [Gordonia amicalis]|uniref:hypothetical protein n=1 Tax=Gordonia amicalis TaxID=89053 RepID=UPI0002A62728|nr:hypothetical protein [Gordonia amicalis]NKX77508.1 hypothetical protein [Gordonia amicalis]GAC52381.1 hypothetical protein GOAMI_09_01050 [Gordonia amicalis NBRC 100051 = JCM 11271]
MTTLQVKRRPVGRLSVAVGVQICSNASNFLLTMAVARAMTTDAVGVYAVIMSVTGILVGLVRAYTGEPISFGERAVADLEARGRAQRAVASSLVLGVCTVLLVTPLMLVALPDYKDAVVFFAVFAPFAIAQDCLRFVLVAGGHLTRALASEATWLLTQTAFLLLLLSFDSLSAMISAWGVGAIAAFIVGLRAYGFRLPFRSTWSWLGLLRRPGSFYMLDYVVAGGLTQAAILIVGAVSGLDAAGVVRVAMLLLTPASVLFVGLVFALGPVCARAAGSGNIKRLKKVPFALAGTVFGVIVVYLSVALVVPSSWWSIIGGDSTDAALNILPLAALALALNSASVGPGLSLRAIGQVSKSSIVKLVAAPFTLIAVAFGSFIGGAGGSQVGLALGTGARTCVTSVVATRLIRAEERRLNVG